MLAGLALTGVLAVALFTFKDQLLERWYLHALEEADRLVDKSDRDACLRKLESLHSPRLEDWYLKKLETGDPAERAWAGGRLASMKSVKAIPAFLSELRRDPRVPPRCRIRGGPTGGEPPYTNTGYRTPGAFCSILELKDSFWKTCWAGKGLAAVGVAAIPTLIEAIRDPDVFVAVAASEALGDLGTDAVSPLCAVLEDPATDMYTRDRAAYSLAKMGPRTVEAIPRLVAIIRKNLNHHSAIQECCGWVIGRIGPGAARAADDLKEILSKEQNPDVRYVLQDTLSRIGAKD